MDKDDFVLTYEQAIEQAYRELKNNEYSTLDSIINADTWIHEYSIYPQNEELYNIFLEDNNFNFIGFYIFVMKNIESEDYEDTTNDDYLNNAPCDNSGFCIGNTCKYYFSTCNRN
jgi:hypothetical protein